jgi:hypothetical protein
MERVAGHVENPEGTPGVIALQRCLSDAANSGWADVVNGGAIHAIPFFRGLQIILKLLVSKGQVGHFRDAAIELSSLPDPAPLIHAPNRSVFFESQSVECRNAVMCLAAWIIEEWPRRFVEVCRKAGLRAARLTQDQGSTAPYWIWKIANESLSLKFDHWRRNILPEGMVTSYADLGRKVTSRKLIAEAARIRWVQQHAELWEKPLDLAKGLKKAGLYSPSSAPSIIAKHCPEMVLLANRKNIRPIAGCLSIHKGNGKRRFVHASSVET